MLLSKNANKNFPDKVITIHAYYISNWYALVHLIPVGRKYARLSCCGEWQHRTPEAAHRPSSWSESIQGIHIRIPEVLPSYLYTAIQEYSYPPTFHMLPFSCFTYTVVILLAHTLTHKPRQLAHLITPTYYHKATFKFVPSKLYTYTANGNWYIYITSGSTLHTARLLPVITVSAYHDAPPSWS